MLSHFSKRFQVLAFVGLGAALTGCTAVPDVTESVASAEGTWMTTDGAGASVKLANVTDAPTFDAEDPSAITASIDVPLSDGGTESVNLTAHILPGTYQNADVASFGTQICVCREDPSEPSSCLDTPVCHAAAGTFAGVYDESAPKNGNRLHQFDATFTLSDPAGYSGTIHFEFHEDWVYNSDSSGGGNSSFWNTNWNG